MITPPPRIGKTTGVKQPAATKMRKRKPAMPTKSATLPMPMPTPVLTRTRKPPAKAMPLPMRRPGLINR